MKKFISVLFFLVAIPSLSFAESTTTALSIAKLQIQIQALLTQIQALQQQEAVLRNESGSETEVQAETETTAPKVLSPQLTRTLRRGSFGDDVRGLQELLSRDKEIYPEGLISGYYGSLTETAVKRWQEKQGIEATGRVGPRTLVRFKEIREQQASLVPTTPAIPTTRAEPVGHTGTTTVPAVPGQSTTTTLINPTCAKDPIYCMSQKECMTSGFSWYTMSCHLNPPRQNSCAASYNYCVGPTECSLQGWYWCRNSCYGSSDACLGQTYVPPVQPVTPIPTPVPAPTPTSPTPIVPPSPATTTAPTSTSTPPLSTSATTSDTLAPSVPTNLIATADSQAQITLSWPASTDNVEVVGYKIYRNGILFVASLGAGPGMRYYPDTNLQPSTSYTYTVAAYDAAGNISAQSSQATAISPSTSIPTGEITIVRPVGGLLSLVQGSSYTVRWTASPPTTTGTIKIKLQQSNGGSVVDVYQIASDVPNNGSYVWTVPSTYSGGSYSLSIGNWPSYPYRVSNDFSIISPTQSTTVQDTTPPSTLPAPTLSIPSSSQINLSWPASTDTVGVVGYKIYRCTCGSDANMVYLASVTGLSYSDTGLTGFTTYTYAVVAYDAAGNNSSRGPGASGTTFTAATATTTSYNNVAPFRDRLNLTASILEAIQSMLKELLKSLK